MTLSVVAVDDEPLSLKRLERLVGEIEGATLLETATNGADAVELVRRCCPDVVLLDIEMPGIGGIEAAKQITQSTEFAPAIIFCTAYDHYAVDAFSVDAVGYLLKPIVFKDLKSKLVSAAKMNSLQARVFDNLNKKKESSQTVLISTLNGIKKIPINDFHYFRAENKVVLAGFNGRETVVDYTLKELAEYYSEHLLRVHRSVLVNTANLSEIRHEENGVDRIYLKGCEQSFVVSRRHAAEVRRCFR